MSTYGEKLIICSIHFGQASILQCNCKKIGFMSKNVQNFLMNVRDHHITWHVFLIALQIFAKELLYVCIDAINEGNSPSVSHLHSWEVDLKIQI